MLFISHLSYRPHSAVSAVSWCRSHNLTFTRVGYDIPIYPSCVSPFLHVIAFKASTLDPQPFYSTSVLNRTLIYKALYVSFPSTISRFQIVLTCLDHFLIFQHVFKPETPFSTSFSRSFNRFSTRPRTIGKRVSDLRSSIDCVWESFNMSIDQSQKDMCTGHGDVLTW